MSGKIGVRRRELNIRVSEDFVITTYERLFCPKAIRIPQFLALSFEGAFFYILFAGGGGYEIWLIGKKSNMSGKPLKLH